MLEDLLKGNGIPSVCSAHPAVLKEAFRTATTPQVLIESTCNQVNQFGGYSGMTPDAFAAYVKRIAEAVGFSSANILLGGDHLGPHPWKDEPSNAAMQKSIVMVKTYVHAGYRKLHLDCSMHLADDPPGPPDPHIIAQRAARLAQAAEEAAAGLSGNLPCYVIGTEVPVPGGALTYETGTSVTRPSDVAETLEIQRNAFLSTGLHQTWERVIAVVVQPGVEFGDDFVLAYKPEAARELSSFIEGQHMVYEAHSTDYQSRQALRELVRDHFAILKVGPALTYAYREAVFSLAAIEDELVPGDERSNIVSVLDEVMLQHPEHWQSYYTGTPGELDFKRKYSLSDRIRYYWVRPEVQNALEKLMRNLSALELPASLVSQHAPLELVTLAERNAPLIPEAIISARISRVLSDYWAACEVN